MSCVELAAEQAEVSGNVTIKGDATLKGLTTLGTEGAGITAEVYGDIRQPEWFPDTMFSTGTNSFGPSQVTSLVVGGHAQSQLSCGGPTYFQKDVTVGQRAVPANETIYGTLTVTGATTLGDVAAPVNVNGSLDVELNMAAAGVNTEFVRLSGPDATTLPAGLTGIPWIFAGSDDPTAMTNPTCNQADPGSLYIREYYNTSTSGVVGEMYLKTDQSHWKKVQVS